MKEFFGVLSEAKVLVAMISQRYWRSRACVRELMAALEQSIPVIPVFLESAPAEGHFLGKTEDQIKVF